jgi:hypothetical protein
MRLLFISFVAFMLGGCASPSLYQWGAYESLLYAGYKDPEKMGTMMTKLETHIAGVEKSGRKVAPGLYAELGTLYLQSGSSDKAVAMYARERDEWPESKGLMTAMINNLERRQKASAETKQ